VLIAGFPAGSFATNCYVVAPGPGEECIIIDPGQDAEPGVTELLAEYRLRPVAVLATHGHVDHIWSVAPVCGAQGIPAYIHPADRDLLSDPAKGFPLQVGQQLFRGLTFTEPDDVIELADGMTLRLAGVEPDGGPCARSHTRLGDVPDRQSGGTSGAVSSGRRGPRPRDEGTGP
jgi:hydroxyacylglutathione hydrolase